MIIWPGTASGAAANERSKLALKLEPLVEARAKLNRLATQNNNAGRAVRAVRQISAEQVPIETRKEVAAGGRS
jgi:hypothetical protein